MAKVFGSNDGESGFGARGIDGRTWDVEGSMGGGAMWGGWTAHHVEAARAGAATTHARIVRRRKVSKGLRCCRAIVGGEISFIDREPLNTGPVVILAGRDGAGSNLRRVAQSRSGGAGGGEGGGGPAAGVG